jgi:MFS family permease
MTLPKSSTLPFNTLPASKCPRPISYLIYGLVALFLFYEMALQVSPSIITIQLMHDLNIEAASLGMISGIYFYSYMLMQIPSGLLFDRQRARVLIPLAILLCVLGTFFFTTSHTSVQAAFGRFLMGIGSSCAFISVLVVSSRWFPSTYFALLVGVAQFLAAAGALGGEAPLALVIHHLGWREVFYWLIGAGALLAIVIWYALKNEPTAHLAIKNDHTASLPAWQSLKTVLKSSQNWWIALYAFCGWGPVAIFASLWGVPYLMSVYHTNSATAALACAMIWIGLMVGSPFFGWYSSKLAKHKPFLKACSLLGLVASLIILYLPGLPFWLMALLLLGFGIAAAGHILTFALAKESNPAHLTATAIGFNNMAVVAGGAIFQPLVGLLLHLTWQGTLLNGVPVYSVHSYRIALCMVPLCFLIGFLVSQFCIRKKY